MEFVGDHGMCIMNTFFQHHARRLYTWTSPDGSTKNQIDYVIVPQRWKTSVLNVKTRPGADCGSDHVLLECTISVKIKALKKKKTNVKYDVKNISHAYKVDVRNRFAILAELAEEKDPDTLANDACDILLEAAAEHLPRKRKAKQQWMRLNTLDLIEERRLMKSSGKGGSDEYRLLNKQIKRACKDDKIQFLSDKCGKIEDCMARNDSKGMFEEIKSMSKSTKPRLGVIKNIRGETLTQTADILNRWKEYCEKMYEAPERSTSDECDDEAVGADDDDLEPLKVEVEAAIKALKDGKSPGCDEISAELIKASGDEGIQVYHKLCCKIWRTGQWPQNWKRAVFVPLPKKGDLQLCSNYRTISLISHASKIMLKILQWRLSRKLEDEIGWTQAGFRSGRGTRDHIFNLQVIIQKCREFGQELRVCFIDYSKAFDCVKHSELWKTLRAMGFGRRVVSLIKDLYMGQESAVRLEDDITEWFSVQKGVRQGCILSPYLFSAYTEQIMREVNSDVRSSRFDVVRVNGAEVGDLRYADDTALLSTSASGLESLMKTVKDHSEEKGLLLNVKKTKIMDSKDCKEPSSIRIGNELVERVNSFEYLGAVIRDDGDCSREVKRRLAIASRKLVELEKLWSSADVKLKLRTLLACVFPVALYGCDAWTFSKNIVSRLNGFENKCYRKILKVRWTEKRTNESIHRELNVSPGTLFFIAKTRKMKYFGHVKRHESLEKLVMEGKIDGKRGRGRPRRSWDDDIKEWTGRNVVCAGRLAMDRRKYREMIRAATSHPG